MVKICEPMKTSETDTALSLISQYGSEAETIAMLRAAEYAASFQKDDWIFWEQVLIAIKEINESPSLDG